MPRSITNAVIDADPSSGGAVRMYTTSTSASGPFVIHIFVPFATSLHRDVPPDTPSRRSRRSRRRSRSSRARRRARRSADAEATAARCSGVPCAQRLCTHRFECAAYDMPVAADARETPPSRRDARGSRVPRRRRRRPPTDRAARGHRAAARAGEGTSRRGRSRSAFGASSRSANVRTESRRSSIEGRSLIIPTRYDESPRCGHAKARARSKVAPDDAAGLDAGNGFHVARLTTFADPATQGSPRTRPRCATSSTTSMRGSNRCGGAGRARRPSDTAAGQAHRPGTHRAAPRPRLGLPRALPARGVRPVRRRRAGRRHRHRDRARSTARPA